MWLYLQAVNIIVLQKKKFFVEAVGCRRICDRLASRGNGSHFVPLNVVVSGAFQVIKNICSLLFFLQFWRWIQGHWLDNSLKDKEIICFISSSENCGGPVLWQVQSIIITPPALSWSCSGRELWSGWAHSQGVSGLIGQLPCLQISGLWESSNMLLFSICYQDAYHGTLVCILGRLVHGSVLAECALFCLSD